jgi:NTP pyrophosphatase (non-canonical NTP hydrolase)
MAARRGLFHARRKVHARAELAQGFVGDVGDLMKLVMSKEGLRTAKNLDAALAHELADCLWSVLVLADAYEVDLASVFRRTMTRLERKLTVRRRAKARLKIRR